MKQRSVLSEEKARQLDAFLARWKKMSKQRLQPVPLTTPYVMGMRNTTIHYHHLSPIVSSIDAQILCTLMWRIHARKPS